MGAEKILDQNVCPRKRMEVVNVFIHFALAEVRQPQINPFDSRSEDV